MEREGLKENPADGAQNEAPSTPGPEINPFDQLEKIYGKERVDNMKKMLLDSGGNKKLTFEEAVKMDKKVRYEKIMELHALGQHLTQEEKDELLILRRAIMREESAKNRKLLEKKYRVNIRSTEPMQEDEQERWIEFFVNDKTYRFLDGADQEVTYDVLDVLRNSIREEHFKSVTSDGRKTVKIKKKRLYIVTPSRSLIEKSKAIQGRKDLASYEETMRLTDSGPDEVVVKDQVEKLPSDFYDNVQCTPEQRREFDGHFQEYDTMNGFASEDRTQLLKDQQSDGMEDVPEDFQDGIE